MRIKRGRVELDPRVLGDGSRLHPETSGAVRVLKQLVRCPDTPINGVHGLRPQGQGLPEAASESERVDHAQEGQWPLEGYSGLGQTWRRVGAGVAE